MERVLLSLILAGMISSSACGSKVETRRKIEATQGQEEGAEHEHRTGYRQLEGSPYNSAEEADAQLAGE